MAAFGAQFHHFHDALRHPPGLGSIGADELRRMIDFIGRQRILPAAEWIDRAAGDTLPADAVCLTFDDTLRCQYDVAAPVLRERGLSACFMVNTSVLTGGMEMLELHRRFRARFFPSVEAFCDAFEQQIASSRHCHRVSQALLRFNARSCLPAAVSPVERRFRFIRDDVLGHEAYHEIMDRMIADHGIEPSDLAAGVWMTPDHLLTLHREGHVIGLHSHTHPTRMARLSPQQQRDEYTANWRMVRQITGAAPTVMSHPCDSYSPYTLSILRQLGVRAGFRASMVDRPPGCAFEHSRQCQAMIARGMTAPAALAA